MVSALLGRDRVKGQGIRSKNACFKCPLPCPLPYDSAYPLPLSFPLPITILMLPPPTDMYRTG